MKTRRLKIGIRGDIERSASLRNALKQAAADLVPQGSGLYFENVEQLRKILTEKRLGLLQAIGRYRPESVHQLAALLRRNYKNVSTDLAMLEQLGLVTLRTEKGKGRAQVPTVPYDEIQFTIDLRHQRANRAA